MLNLDQHWCSCIVFGIFQELQLHGACSMDIKLDYSSEFNLKQYQSNQLAWEPRITYTHRIHVWNIYQHLPHKWPSFVGKYTSTMDPMGYTINTVSDHTSDHWDHGNSFPGWGPHNLMEAVGTAQSFDLGLPGQEGINGRCVWRCIHRLYMCIYVNNDIYYNILVNLVNIGIPGPAI